MRTVVLMQSYNAFADSAHVPVVVISFFAAQQPSIVASSGAQRLTAASAKWSENAQNDRQQQSVHTFLWPDFEFLDVHARRVGDVAIDGTASPRQCQPPPSTRTTRVHPLSLHLSRPVKLTLPTAVRRILQEAKELANDESTDYTAAPLEVCRNFPPPTRQTFTHLTPGRHIRESYPHRALPGWIFICKSKEWHCTIRGPTGTEFEGGLYHFRILLPSEYPFRPPSILMLTPNGRFELNTKARSLTSQLPQSFTHLSPRSVLASPTVRSVPDAMKSFHPQHFSFNRSRRVMAARLGC